MTEYSQKAVLSVIKWVAGIQRSLSAKHTAYYLAFESLVYGAVIVSIALLSRVLSLSVAPFLFGSYFLFSLSTYVILIARKESKTPAVAEMDFKTAFIIFSVATLPLLFAYGLENSVLSLLIGMVSLLIYLLGLQYRNQRYLGVSEFFVNKYSEAYADWVEASVALEKALKFSDSNSFRSYYWALRAEHSYRRAALTDTLELRDIAAEFASSASLISAAMVASSGYKSMYISEAYSSLNRAIEKSKSQLCDNCDRQLHIGSIPVQDMNRGQVNMCSHCRTADSSKTEEYRTRDRDGPDRKSRYRRQTTREERKRQERRKKWEEWQRNAHRSGENATTGSSADASSDAESDNSSSESVNMSVKESLDVLGLSEEVDDVSEVTRAFREQVKEVHPDAGGSAEAFKEAKQARDALVKHIK